jgi:hypothetical protein
VAGEGRPNHGTKVRRHPNDRSDAFGGHGLGDTTENDQSLRLDSNNKAHDKMWFHMNHSTKYSMIICKCVNDD